MKNNFYVIIHNTNNHTFEYINVFDYINENMLDSKVNNGVISSYEDLYDEIKQILMSVFFSRSQYELYISDIFKKNIYKIDAYEQLLPNLPLIVDMINSKYNFDKVNLSERSFGSVKYR